MVTKRKITPFVFNASKFAQAMRWLMMTTIKEKNGEIAELQEKLNAENAIRREFEFEALQLKNKNAEIQEKLAACKAECHNHKKRISFLVSCLTKMRYVIAMDLAEHATHRARNENYRVWFNRIANWLEQQFYSDDLVWQTPKEPDDIPF